MFSMKSDRDIFIRGEGIVLRALRESDLQGSWHTWFNDPEVNIYQNKGIYPNTRKKQADFFASLNRDYSQVTLAIEAVDRGVHIGNVTLKNLSDVHRSAELGIVIGDKAYWGKGYGAQAWWLMTRYGFLTLNLNRIMAHIFKGNQRSLRASSRSGFLVEGEMTDYYYRNGTYHNVVVLAVTSRRWRKLFGAEAATPFSQAPFPGKSAR